jgi:ABC-type sugar transport system ATPase subunit
MRLVADSIDKAYGSTQALRGVSVTLEAGQVHALVGENGAGKSTLLKILAGAERPDRGAMTLGGVPHAPRDLRAAEAEGVALVFQEVTINTSLSVAENVYIDRLRDFSRCGLLDRKRLERHAQEVLDGFSAGISVRTPIDRLDHGKWKCIEIARALSHRPKVLFLDEATAFLSHQEVDAVLAAIGALKRSGLTIAFVSHHLSEVGAVADRLTVLKDGQWVGSYAAGELSGDEIHMRMVGRDVSGRLFPARPVRSVQPSAIALDDVSAGPQLRDFSLDVQAGEIVGVAGLKGSGGETLLEVLVGARPLDGGRLQLAGRLFRPTCPADAWQAGVAYVPGDRGNEGLIAEFAVGDNLLMSAPPRKRGFYDSARAEQLAADLVARLRIKAPTLSQPCKTLSGGNLQKVVLGKCIAAHPRVLLLNNPTRGVDIGARVEIYKAIRELADQGLAVVIVSDDLPELIGLAERLVVMRSGRLEHAFAPGAQPSEDDVVRHMA